jgi:hypothetical protein
LDEKRPNGSEINKDDRHILRENKERFTTDEKRGNEKRSDEINESKYIEFSNISEH